MPTDLRTHLADLVADLVDPYEHVEEYEHEKVLTLRSAIPDDTPPREVVTMTTRTHRVRFPPLLDQLGMAVEPSSSTEAGARGYESSPSARLDAIDRLHAIHRGIAGWRVDIGSGALPPVLERTTPAQTLRAFVGADLADEDLRPLVADVKTWLTWARVVTGWETPPMRPSVRCLACNKLGSLRVRVDPLNACCVACGAAWDETNAGLLAEAIRTAEHQETPMPERPAIWIDPSQSGGTPMVKGVPAEVIACALLAGQTISAVVDTHDLTRADVLAACWYLGRYSRTWRAGLHQWSRAVEHALELGQHDAIPDPPIGRVKRLQAAGGQQRVPA